MIPLIEIRGSWLVGRVGLLVSEIGRAPTPRSPQQQPTRTRIADQQVQGLAAAVEVPRKLAHRREAAEIQVAELDSGAAAAGQGLQSL